MPKRRCWTCQSPLGLEETICEACSKIQPYTEETDYFACLGLDRFLQIDLKELEKRFYRLSRRFHPDFHYGKGDTEKNISLENSALLNKAYRTLRDPFLRVEYLIRLEEGGKNDIAAKVPQEFLEEIFGLQETIDEFRSTIDREIKEELGGKLQEALEVLEDRQSDQEKGLFELFGHWDKAGGHSDRLASLQEGKPLIREMREILSYRTYFRNMIQDIQDLLQGHTKRREVRH
ncbi:MAG: Fe-S protein assembly co-chaperone HscB [Nitrospiria bacterium]